MIIIIPQAPPFCILYTNKCFPYLRINIKSWRQHPTKHQLYGHLPPITKTIKVRRTIHAGHCWRSRDELISDVLLWTPTCGRAKAGRPARTYIQQLCEDMGYSPEDLLEAMNDRGEVARDGQGYPCKWHDMMILLIINDVISYIWIGILACTSIERMTSAVLENGLYKMGLVCFMGYQPLLGY